MSKLGIHISGSATGLDEALQKCYNAGSPIPVLYSVDQNLYSNILKYSPTTKLIYRRQTDMFNRLPTDWYKDYDNDNWKVAAQNSATNWLINLHDPADRGRNLIQNWQLNIADWYDPLNEPVVEFGDVLKARWLNAWEIKALEIVNTYGLKLALFSFPTGSPKLDPNIINELLPCLRFGKQSGAVLSLHAYWENKDPSTDLADALLYRQFYQMIPEDAKLPLVISEASSGNGYGVSYSGSDWVNDMIKWDSELMKDPFVIGGCAFQLGVGTESNMAEVIPQYGDYISTHPTPPIEEDMGLDIIVVEHLIPQDTTPTEYDFVQTAALPVKQDILYSADVAKYLVSKSLPGSKVIVWNPERWTQGDILAYLGVPTEVRHFGTTDIPPVNLVAKRGLHMRADGNSPAKDLECITVGKLNAAKIMTNTSFEEFAALRNLIPAENIVLRLFAAGNNPSLKNAAQFCTEQNLWLKEFSSRGGKYVEVHNEPNLTVEGLGYAWTNPAGFAAWYVQVYDWIKARYPSLQIGYPGLSPQPNVPEWLNSLNVLLSQGKVDWIGAHSYWVNASDMLSTSGGQYYKTFLSIAKQYNKIVILTEFANVSAGESHTVKGQQYKQYYTSLDKQVWGAFAFVSSASDPGFNTTKQTWVMNNVLTDIPRQVGS